MKNQEYHKLSIQASDPAERRVIFARTCALLSLDQAKEVQKQKIVAKADGLDVSINHLIVLCFMNNLHGGFDFRAAEEKPFFINVPSLPSVGSVAVNAPETIKPTSVDEVIVNEAPKVQEEAKPLPGATFESAFESVGNDEAKETPPAAATEQPDDDDSPF